MTSSPSGDSDSSRGNQQPRIRSVPTYATSAGAEVIKVAALAGINLDPWQQYELTDGLGESSDWKCPRCVYRSFEPVSCPDHPREDLIHPWAAFEVCEVVPRQNGKSELLVARMLGGLFVLEEPLQIFSAHQFDTAVEIFRRLALVIENSDDLRGEVKQKNGRLTGIKYGHGEEGVELASGLRIRFKARTGGGGRGFSCDTLYLDEAMILPEAFLGATIPTLSARANPQIWLAGSPPDAEDPTHDGIVLTKRRIRALAGGDPSLAYFEHSAAWDGDPSSVPEEILASIEERKRANPGFGIRISGEYIEGERRAMGARQFAIERMGIGAWSNLAIHADRKISPEAWGAANLVDRKSEAEHPVCLSFDVTPDRAWASIGLAGNRDDGLGHLEVLKHARTPFWVVDQLVAFVLEHDPIAIVWDRQSPAAALEKKLCAALEDAGVPLQVGDHDLLVPVGAADFAQACGMIVDEVDEQAFRHLGQEDLATAIEGATPRRLGDEAFLWSRKDSSVDISTLVTVTLAHWGFVTHQAPPLVPMVAFR